MLHLGNIFNINVKLVIVIPLMLLFFILGLSLSRVNFNSPAVTKLPINKTYVVEGMNLRLSEAHSTKQVKIAGKTLNAPSDKKFLVIFTEIENASSSAKQTQLGDWLRIEEDSKKLPPLNLNAYFATPPNATLEKQLVFLVGKNKSSFSVLVEKLEERFQLTLP